MAFSLGSNNKNYQLPIGNPSYGAPSNPLRTRGSHYELNGGMGLRNSASSASLRSVSAASLSNLTGEDGALTSVGSQIHNYIEQVDSFLGRVGAPLKPFLPVVGRFLIVATFFEDGLRIYTQWYAQVSYISSFRGLHRGITMFYLALNILLMYGASGLVVAHKALIYAIASLIFVVVSQAIVYGLVFNLHFFFRNLSVIGGLFMVLSDAFVRDRRALSVPGLPLLDDKNRAKYFQLAGRILLILLYFAYAFSEQRTILRIVFSIFGFAACILVAIGYKARLSASVLVIMLFIRNLTSNQYWRYDSNNPIRDFLRYEHFQILSIIGGLLLIVNSGAGAISIDEKKKIY